MAKQTDPGLEALGIQMVAEEEVPEPGRQNKDYTPIWTALTSYLPSVPGQWAKAVTFESATGAGAKATSINKGNDKKFAAAAEQHGGTFEARAHVDEPADAEKDVKGSSTLYVRFVAG